MTDRPIRVGFVGAGKNTKLHEPETVVLVKGGHGAQCYHVAP